MNYIKLIDGKSYLPQNKISNEEIENEKLKSNRTDKNI